MMEGLLLETSGVGLVVDIMLGAALGLLVGISVGLLRGG
jgi:hypothetical protein